MKESTRRELEERDLMGLAERCADRCNVTVDDIFSRSRRGPEASARAYFAACLYARGHWSYPAIGALLGRDHTTIMVTARRVSPAEIYQIDGQRETERLPPDLTDGLQEMRYQ